MSTSETSLGRNPGLSNVVDIVVAPNAAFDRLRLAPTWGWAFIAVTVLGIIGTLLELPAIAHAIDVSLPAQLAANPQIAKLPPDQQQAAISRALGVTKFILNLSWIVVPIGVLIVGLIQGLVMSVANAIGRGAGSFKQFFALSVTVGVVGYGLNALITGIITTVRGAGSFDNPTAIQAAIPSLAMLAPSAHGFLLGFLGAFNVFVLWGTALLALGMMRIARLSPAIAWTAAILMLLIAACFAGWGGARNG